MLNKLQSLILNRSSPFFVQHIRAHTGLPGPLAEGNDLVDKAARAASAFLIQTPVELAREFHSQFHVNSKTLSSRFHITRAEARDIVTACKACAPLLPQASVGVNPRGLLPLHIWQMDVTHFSEFGKLQFVHVSVDTASGVLFASLHTGKMHSMALPIALRHGVHGVSPESLRLIMALLILQLLLFPFVK